MTGWIIYSKEDVEKNKYYIQMYVDKFKKYNVDIQTIVVQDIENIEEFIKNNRPDFAINRSRFEDIAAKLQNTGVRVFNSSQVTRVANDKAETYEFLKDTVSFMPVKCEEREIISGIESNGFSFPYVVKSCGGHGGSQVFMATDNESLEEAVRQMNGEKYLVQQCCSDLGKDVRIYIIGNEIVTAMLRTSTESFKSNYSLGGKAEVYELNEKEERMVKAIIKKLPIDFGGIDFTFHNGKAVFNEIEDAVGARMLYNVAGIDIVQIFINYIVEVLGI